MKTLFLHPPSFDGYDGGAGSRYQARREVRSFWYPTWLAQPAALVPGSRLVDAPPAGLGLDDVLPLGAAVRPRGAPHQRAVVCPRREGGRGAAGGEPGPARRLRRRPRGRAREAALAASPAIEFVAGAEFDFTIQEIAEGRPLDRVAGRRYRTNGHLHRTPERPPLRGHGRGCPSWWTSTSATSRSSSTSSATCSIPTSRSTPAGAAARSAPSASGRRRWAVTATARARSSNVVAEIDHARAALSAGEGVLLRRRHLHRRPAAGRGHRAGARAAWA